MKLQTFNIRAPHSGFFLATIQLKAKSAPEKTAERIRNYIARRMYKGVTVHPVLND